MEDDFNEAVKPAIKWLCENMHPHAGIIITPTCAELVTGERVFNTEEFLRD